eukprot:3941493-Rhodomonas_salina.1
MHVLQTYLDENDAQEAEQLSLRFRYRSQHILMEITRCFIRCGQLDQAFLRFGKMAGGSNSAEFDKMVKFLAHTTHDPTKTQGPGLEPVTRSPWLHSETQPAHERRIISGLLAASPVRPSSLNAFRRLKSIHKLTIRGEEGVGRRQMWARAEGDGDGVLSAGLLMRGGAHFCGIGHCILQIG